MLRYCIVILILFVFCEFVHPQSIKTITTGIRSDKGVIIVSLFENQEQFRSDQPALVKNISKEGLKDSRPITRLNTLSPKVYGIAILDDENENGEMDYRFKRPTE